MKISDKRIIFFYPYYHTGGAERVHAEIIKSLYNKNNIVILTDRSRDNRFKKDFFANAKCVRLFGIPNKIKFINKLLIILVSYIINKKKNIILIGSNSRFFYSLLPFIRRNIYKIDIIHWLDGMIGKMSLENTDYIDRRIVITPALLPVLKNKYLDLGLNTDKLKKVKVIQNGVAIPRFLNKNYDGRLGVLYIGRDSYEKRPELAVKVWQNIKNSSNINFLAIGRGLKRCFVNNRQEKTVYEYIDSDDKIKKIYKNFHVIYLTSLFEGFPMVFMEAMSHGLVPVTTSVGGISNHLVDYQNAMLVKDVDEEKIIEKISERIIILDNNRELLKKISFNCYVYAKNNFGLDNFYLSYRKVINEIWR